MYNAAPPKAPLALSPRASMSGLLPGYLSRIISGEPLMMYVPSKANKIAATSEKKKQQIAHPDGPLEVLVTEDETLSTLDRVEFNDPLVLFKSGLLSITSRGSPPVEKHVACVCRCR